MHQVFSREIKLISNNEIAAFTGLVLDNAPPKFWTLPASSTNKYHPKTSNVEHGLVIHTKQVVWIANTIMDTRLEIVNCNRDIVISSCILHDIEKYKDNNSNYTANNHAAGGVDFILGLEPVKQFMSIYTKQPSWFSQILLCIKSHNGIFSTEYNGSFNVEQSIVHIADFIASRKWCEFRVDLT